MKKLVCLIMALLVLAAAAPASALSYDELLQKAEEYTVSGEADKAFACYDLAIRSDPGNTAAYIMAGLLHLDRGEMKEAEECIGQAMAADATSPDAWAAKCRLDAAAGDTEAFEADAVYAEVCGADLSGFAAEIGEMYIKAGYPDKAAEYLPETAAGAPDEGREAGRQRNEKLDAAFGSGTPVLTETGTLSVRPEASDFEILEEAGTALRAALGIQDLGAVLEGVLAGTEFVLISRSPAGNSGIVSAGETAVLMYNGKYHVPWPSPKSVSDDYGNLQRFGTYFENRFPSLLGEEGIVYSPDGRYAAILNMNITLIKANMFLDPIVLDLSTGEMILTATYPDKFREDGMGAVSSAVFSSDGRFFYYIVFGIAGDARTRLYRYDLGTGETELCLQSDQNLYFPHLAELEDGSFLMINDRYKKDEAQGLVKATCRDGVWSLEETMLDLPYQYSYSTILNYAPASGLACLPVKTAGNPVAFQLVNPNAGFDGLNRYLCIRKDSGEIVSLTAEEFRDAVYADLSAGDSKGFSIDFPYQAIYNTVFSPDGNYLLLNTVSSSSEGISRNLYLVRIEDLSARKVSGLDAEDIMLGSKAAKFPMVIEWNTDELIICTSGGIRAFEFTAGE